MFRFKQFSIHHDRSSMKVNTDGILLGAWADVTNNKRILDVGCGCGLITLMLAQRNLDAQVIGVEIDSPSCLDALENSKSSPFCNRIEVANDSIQVYSKKVVEAFDHIVSNPPFFTQGILPENESKVNVRHAVSLSHTDLISSAKQLLTETGTLSVVLPINEGSKFIEMAKDASLYLTRKCTVYTRKSNPPERLLMTFINYQERDLISEKIVIHLDDSNKYTDEFIKLTKAFYLNM